MRMRCRSEWVIRVVFQFLERFEFIGALGLVGIKPKIDAGRHIVGVHRHTFEVMLVADLDPDLGVVRGAQRQLRNPSTDFYDAVTVCPALFCPPDREALRIESTRFGAHS